jgi:hypothetical protein
LGWRFRGIEKNCPGFLPDSIKQFSIELDEPKMKKYKQENKA